MLSGRWWGAGQVAAAACAWGCWSLVLRPAGLPAAVAGAVILVAQGLVLLPAVARAPPARPWDARSIRWLLALSLCDALNVLFFFAALERTTIAVAVLTHYLAPVLVALAAPWLGCAPVRGARLAALAAMAGLALLLEPWRAPSEQVLVGAALGAASAFAYAGNVLASTVLLPRIGAARTIGYHSLIAAALVALVLPFTGLGDVDARGIALVAAAGAVIGGGGAALFLRGLRVVGPTRAALLTYFEPLTAVLVGAWVWGERHGPFALLGAALVLGAGIVSTGSGGSNGGR